MKRDMDLVRKILLTLEEWEPSGGLTNPEVEGYDPYVVGHHVLLMEQAGLVDTWDGGFDEGPLEVRYAKNLTWQGHDALANFRSEGVWSKTKAAVAKVGDAGIGLWIEVAASLVKEQLGLKV